MFLKGGFSNVTAFGSAGSGNKGGGGPHEAVMGKEQEIRDWGGLQFRGVDVCVCALTVFAHARVAQE